MLRAVTICALLAACEPRLRPSSLPELVKPPPQVAMQVPMLMLEPGEQMRFRVSAKGLVLGIAELSVEEHEVRSRFETGKLVSMFGHARHELVTTLGTSAGNQGAPSMATDILDIDGETTRVSAMFSPGKIAMSDKVTVVPDGNSGHTLHSALGLLRAWAKPNARPGWFYLLHAGDLYRVDVGQPFEVELGGRPALRVEIRVAAQEPVAITMWLREQDRAPLRFEISVGDVRATAVMMEAGDADGA